MLKLFTKKWRARMKSEADTNFGVCDGIWTPVVDTGVITAPQLSDNTVLANKAVQITGLAAPATVTIGADDFTVSNGNIAIFNIDGDIVTVLGSVLVP